MADQSTQTIEIAASPDAIMAVIADFSDYPEWTGSVRECEVLEEFPDGRAKRVRLVIDAGVVRDDYQLEYDWAPDGHKVSWHLVSGQLQKSQHGSYTLEPQGPNSTLVTYSLTVDLSIPMLGLLKRKAEKVIMNTALKELKKRVETRG